MSADHTWQGDCSEVLLRVFEYIDEEMTEEDCERIRAHLDSCGPCMSEYHRDVLLKAIVRRSCTCEPAPAQLRLQILSSITSYTRVSVELRE